VEKSLLKFDMASHQATNSCRGNLLFSNWTTYPKWSDCWISYDRAYLLFTSEIWAYLNTMNGPARKQQMYFSYSNIANAFIHLALLISQKVQNSVTSVY